MDNQSLLLAYGLVLAAIWISLANRLKIEGDLFWSSLRATGQLIAIGFILEFLLKVQNAWVLFAILMAMCAVAGITAGNRGWEIPNSRWIAFLGILAGSWITFAALYFAGVIQPEARFAIPLGGMIIGNAMKACSLTFNRLIAELGHQRARIETLLALGAGPKQAAAGAVRAAVKAAILPTADTMKTVGLVHLPGIMTGFIIAGGSPLMAIKYQLAVIYMIAGATGVTCLTATLLAYRTCFNKNLQLLDRFRPAH